VINWLHVSDFHFDGRMFADGYDVSIVLEPLLATLREHASAFGPPDIVFVTGDIGNTGECNEYREAYS
jgi:3',5'-cyclic AMP phosphodiesterase CpdA